MVKRLTPVGRKRKFSEYAQIIPLALTGAKGNSRLERKAKDAVLAARESNSRTHLRLNKGNTRDFSTL